MGSDFPFNIEDVLSLCSISYNKGRKNNTYTVCPFCGKKKTFNINFDKDSVRCNACGEGGGLLWLYAKTFGLSCSDKSSRNAVAKEIKEKLNISAENFSYLHNKKATPIVKDVVSYDKERIEYIDTVYRAFLNMLSLSKRHYNELKENRKISDDNIKKLMFRSVPVFGYKSICKKLAEKYDLSCVAGFYWDAIAWNININSKATGIIIPTFNAFGKIEGLQIRLDIPFGSAKYLWISSDDLHKGTKVNAIPYYLKGDKRPDTLYITEGAFKVIIPNQYWGCSVLGLAGVNNQSQLDYLLPHFKAQGIKKIIDVFDADFISNDFVAAARDTLKKRVIDNGMIYQKATWDLKEGKGFDDYCLYTLSHKK